MLDEERAPLRVSAESNRRVNPERTCPACPKRLKGVEGPALIRQLALYQTVTGLADEGSEVEGIEGPILSGVEGLTMLEKFQKIMREGNGGKQWLI